GLRQELVNVDGLVEDVRSGAVRQIGDRAVRFTTVVPFSGCFIRTDEEKLRAVLSELVVHAIRRTTSGEVVFAVDFAPDRTDFILRDDRRRPHSTSSLVMPPFGLRTQEWMDALPGDGIGLAIALRLSALLGASLTPGRGEDGGSKFTMSVPGGAITH